jgi:hypothetical protein
MHPSPDSLRRIVLSARLGALTLLVAASAAKATDYYVATTGSDANAGTMAAPIATLQKGVSVAVAGDTVLIRGGTYKITTPITAAAGAGAGESVSGGCACGIDGAAGRTAQGSALALLLGTLGLALACRRRRRSWPS